MLNACVAPGYGVDTGLLTRQAVQHNFASDTCIRKDGIDPDTGDRYLEELAVEIKSTQSIGAPEQRARIMAERGVRRIPCHSRTRGRCGTRCRRRTRGRVDGRRGTLAHLRQRRAH